LCIAWCSSPIKPRIETSGGMTHRHCNDQTWHLNSPSCFRCPCSNGDCHIARFHIEIGHAQYLFPTFPPPPSVFQVVSTRPHPAFGPGHVPVFLISSWNSDQKPISVGQIHISSHYGLLSPLPSGKRLHKTMERSPMLLMGKSTISTAIFNSYLYVYQRVHLKKHGGSVDHWFPHSNDCFGVSVIFRHAHIVPVFVCLNLVSWKKGNHQSVKVIRLYNKLKQLVFQSMGLGHRLFSGNT
jgi:hypothetical protein